MRHVLDRTEGASDEVSFGRTHLMRMRPICNRLGAWLGNLRAVGSSKPGSFRRLMVGGRGVHHGCRPTRPERSTPLMLLPRPGLRAARPAQGLHRSMHPPLDGLPATLAAATACAIGLVSRSRSRTHQVNEPVARHRQSQREFLRTLMDRGERRPTRFCSMRHGSSGRTSVRPRSLTSIFVRFTKSSKAGQLRTETKTETTRSAAQLNIYDENERFPLSERGGYEIRTREGLHPTRFPSERHRPLGESSGRDTTASVVFTPNPFRATVGPRSERGRDERVTLLTLARRSRCRRLEFGYGLGVPVDTADRT